MKQNNNINAEKMRVMEIDWREKKKGGNGNVQLKGRKRCNVISS